MIILPAERRLDRSNVPAVLIGIVLLNILIFFLYQANDPLKFSQALEIYQKESLFEEEWPLYLDYLQQEQRYQDLDDLRALYDETGALLVSAQMLSDRGFADYLDENGRSLFYPSVYYDWADARRRINDEFESVSAVRFGLKPNDLSVVDLVMYQFLHGGFMHLMGNMMFLMICGFVVEGAIGHLAFLGVYLLSGIVAGLVHVAMNQASDQPLVGASGSISAVMAMYLVLYRWQKIRFFYWFYVVVGYFRAPALILLPVYLGKEVLSFYTEPDSNVAFMAHAGGFIAGGVLVGALAYFRPGVLNTQYLEQTEDDGAVYRKHLADIYDALEKYRFDTAFHRIQHAIEEYGNEFELLLLRHNILKLKKSGSWLKNLNLLMAQTDLTEYELQQQEKAWKEAVADGARFGEDVLINIAVNFSRLGNLESSEAIFRALKNRGTDAEKLMRVANFIAKGFTRLQQPDKQQQYRDIAHALMRGV
ncbi:MAG: rhomboid family intramembrane serine protease [Thalassolituus sp.]